MENPEDLLDYLKGAVSEVLPSWNKDVVEDIAMDVYIKLLEKDIEVTHPFTLGYKMAQDAARDHLKIEARRTEILRDSADEIRKLHGHAADDPANVIEAEERMERLDSLSPILRSTVEDYYVDGMSVKEIAAKDGASESAVKVRLHRAREIVKGE